MGAAVRGVAAMPCEMEGTVGDASETVYDVK